MSDESPEDDEEQSFKERVEEIRQQQAEGEEREAPGGGMGEMMGGPGGGMGGNPFAQMMGGMMGGGPGGGGGDVDTERIVGELNQLREAVRETNTQLERIADALDED